MDHSLDPNRYATGDEAADIAARLDEQRALLESMRATDARAEANLETMRAQMREAELGYIVAKERFNAAEAYSRMAKEQYRAQLANVTAQSRLLHPVRKTPLELLGRIFEYCLPDVNTLEYLPEEVPTFHLKQPFVLAAVCRRWRSASLASPRAWSYLSVSLDTIGDDRLGGWIEAIQLMLTRSANVLLDLAVLRKEYPAADDIGQLFYMACVLSQAKQRCRSLHLVVDRIHISDYLANFLSAPAPELLVAQTFFEDLLVRGPGNIQFGALPKLQIISCGPEFAPMLSQMLAATHVHFFSPYVDQDNNDLAILRAKAPNVVELRLTYPHVDQRQPTTAVVFARVTDLCLDVDNDTDVEDLCEILKVPEMQILRTLGGIDTSSRRIALVGRLVNPNNLRTLQFGNLHMEHLAAFAGVIGSLNKIEVLLLTRTTFTRIGFRTYCAALTAKDADNRWRNQYLTQIIFTGCLFPDCDEADILFCAQTLVHGSKVPVDDPTHHVALDHLVVDSWDPATRESLVAQLDEILGTAPECS